ncbi:MAG: RDD family protein [Gammaproteobacteria bacterium]|nr:RDD family protein [Rhodocyclaceae bacterium]MBU3910462.1 RDD family protein [Gammaproteobacteria bacterium]MBU4004943.1 RDD family protein [Gammaproteobacteria bacterium]MBU4020536.1 RDD family protein [Gammaproteobacteria bacterium]MBU4095612.1 RDD family protein [Gammaproteobacteria bacterium]
MSETAQHLAGIRRRLAGMLYESLLLLGVLSVSFMLPHIALGMIWEIVLPGSLLVIHVFLVMGGYFIWYWHHGGQTLAMQTWKLKLVSTNDTPPTLNQLFLRYLLSWPSLLLYGAGLLWALFDRDRQFLHDRLSGTRIIHAQPPSPNGCN